MALDTDSMIDRRRLKRRLALWRIIALGAVLGLIALAIGRAPQFTAEDHVAVLWIEGMILTDPYREEAIRALVEDETVSALIVHIDSPGGDYQNIGRGGSQPLGVAARPLGQP